MYITEVLSREDPRAHSPEMEKAKYSEIRDLIKRGSFKLICERGLQDGANCLTARFVLCIKSAIDGNVRY